MTFKTDLGRSRPPPQYLASRLWHVWIRAVSPGTGLSVKELARVLGASRLWTRVMLGRWGRRFRRSSSWG